MPREVEKDTASAGKQSPEPEKESSQSPEPVSDASLVVGASSELETPVEEDSSISVQIPGDSATSESLSEDSSVCPKCGGKKIKSIRDQELLSESNSDEDIDPIPESIDEGGLKTSAKSNSDGNLAPSPEYDGELKTLPKSNSDGDLKPLKESQLICKCGSEQGKALVGDSNRRESKAGVQEIEKTEGQSLDGQQESSAEKSPEQELFDDSEKNKFHLENGAGVLETEKPEADLAVQERSSSGKSPEQEPVLDSGEENKTHLENAVRETEKSEAEILPLAVPEESSTEKSQELSVEENKSHRGNVSEVQETEVRSLAVREISTETSLEQDLSGDSNEEASCSTSSDSPSANFAVITCVRPRPQRRSSQLDEVSIPLQDCPLLAAAVGDVEEGRVRGRPPARSESPQVELVTGNTARQRHGSNGSITSTEYKSMLRVIGCVIAFVFTVVFALLLAAQLSLNRRLGSDTNSTKDLDRNSTAEKE